MTAFYAGQFVANGPYMEWDGSNEGEIATWLTSVSPNGTVWTIESIDSAGLRLRYEDTSHNSDVHPTVIPLGSWVGTDWADMTVVMPAPGRWKTADPYGRPDRICDVEAPRV